MGIMQAAFMEAVANIDAASPEAIYLVKHKAMDEAITLVASQLSTTRQVETRDLIEGGEFRTGTRKADREPGPCVTVFKREANTITVTSEQPTLESMAAALHNFINGGNHEHC